VPAFVATFKNSRGKAETLTLEAADAVSAKRSLRRRGIEADNIEHKLETAAIQRLAKTANGQQSSLGKSLSSLLEQRPGIKE